MSIIWSYDAPVQGILSPSRLFKRAGIAVAVAAMCVAAGCGGGSNPAEQGVASASTPADAAAT
ncbi:MAG: hypothetical protein ABW032_11820, partial [Burkholderiaceae bacterium]